MSDWFANRRQQWIAEMLQIYGFINREHLILKFDISVPQASNDLTRFQTDHPGLVYYDNSRKCYRATGDK